MSSGAVRALAAALAVAGAAAELNFCAIGDWGGQDTPPFYTPGQMAVAQGMGAVAERIGATFVLGLGDNFYNSGIHGSENSARFDETFESVYTAESLQTPFYFVGGNHDHSGNVSAQIAYSSHSERWTFPDYWYSFSRSFAGEDGSELSAEFIMIDTVLLAGLITYAEGHPLYFSKPPGPLDEGIAQKQWAFIEDAMASSTADYLFVAGHYPVFSVGSHGSTPLLVKKLQPLLKQYAGTSISGHDHTAQHLEQDGVVYLQMGASDECCYSAGSMHEVPAGSLVYYLTGDNNPTGAIGSFMCITLGAASGSATFYDQDGNVLHETGAVLAPRLGRA